MSRLKSKLRAGSSRYKNDDAKAAAAKAAARAAIAKAAAASGGGEAPVSKDDAAPPVGPADHLEPEDRLDRVEEWLLWVVRDISRVRTTQRQLRRDNDRLLNQMDRLESAESDSDLVTAEAELVDELRAELERARTDAESAWRQVDDLHRRLEQTAGARGEAIAGSTELKAENEHLRQQIAELEAELEDEGRSALPIDGDTNDDDRAQRHRIDELEAELEQVKRQRKNLQQLLVERDSQVGDEMREISAEEITQSEVFKKMLAEFKQTVRMEIGYLHNGVATLKDLNPSAYNAVLDHLDAYFEMVNVVNPLAALPKAEPK